ncbi:TRAP transporter substrate-binding protein [Rhodobacteraceae bacterium RKSG542]|uniref:TRAP transporter substrate-binding protein n=1 Tax=Pseudovibrio flavus TaxID=2529854 RepID=UPI0012BD1F35|nr:TRAP transporter substrate-binding protein [Pseudovibrio flavus]MTI16513.1 TRAP transporter substrate-binding protein [Pseudovibrio flavus]
MSANFTKFALGLAVALPTALASFSATAVEAVTIRLAHNLEPSHVVAMALEQLGDDLKEMSGGKMKLRIYGSGQMGGPRETLEMLQQEALDMTKGSASEMEAFESTFSVFSMPYLFRDKAHFHEVLYGEIGREMMALPKDKGFMAIAAYEAGERSFYATKPIKSPADMKGLKIRVVSTPTTNRMIELLGASPAPIAFGEVYTAIQQGVIDGAENNEPSYYHTRHVEVAQHVALDQHTSVPDYLVISTATWDALSAEQQEILMKAARKSEDYQRELWDAEVEKSIKLSKEAGATFYEVDKTAFRAALQPLYDDAAADQNKNAWIQRIEAAGK